MRVLISLMLLISPALSQPAEFYAAYKGMPNVASLEIEFCYIGQHVCLWRRVKAWGQLCDPRLAQEVALERGRAIDGFVFPGMHYAAWRCHLNNPADKPPSGTSGVAQNE